MSNLSEFEAAAATKGTASVEELLGENAKDGQTTQQKREGIRLPRVVGQRERRNPFLPSRLANRSKSKV